MRGGAHERARGSRKGGAAALRRLAGPLLALGLLSGAQPARADEEKKILVLHSYHHDYPWTDQIHEALARGIHEAFPRAVLHVEFMNTKRRDPRLLEAPLVELYRKSYAGLSFDLVVASDNNALDFLLRHRDELFPGVPVVFCGINNVSEYRFDPAAGYTGVGEEPDIASTLALALRLHPGTRRVAVISDNTETGEINLELTRRAARAHPGLELIELRRLTTAQLQARLGELGPDTVVLNVSFIRDADGRTYTPLASMELVVAASPRPVYTCWDYNMAPGALGGKVLSGRLQGEAAARQAVRVLRGEPPASIPIDPAPTSYLLDHTGLRRFDIAEDRLPPGALVVGRPETFYARYRRWVWIGGGLFALQAAIIGLLLWNVARRRREEAAVRDGRLFLETLLEAIPLPVFYKDARGRYLGCNRAYETYFGRTRAELAGKGVLDLWPAHLAERYGAMDLALLVPTAAPTQVYEAQVATGSGEIRDVIFNKARFTDAQGRIAGLIGVVHDVTDRKLAEASYRQLQQRLVQAQKMESVGRLAGGVAHDYNNMLAVIFMELELIKTQLQAGSPLEGSVKGIEQAAQHSRDITQQLLAFSRKQVIAPRLVDLNETIVGLRKSLSRLIGEDVEIRLDLLHGLAPVLLDPAQLDQVLVNLAVNARDAMPRGGVIQIETRHAELDEAFCAAHPDCQPGSWVRLTVRDTGTGMEPETLAHIFEPFFTTKATGKGTGLGLATVFGIVKQNGGSIEVHTEPGRGSAFVIYLPRQEAAAEEPVAVESTAPRGDERVLLVEDDPLLRRASAEVLRALGYQVTVAASADEALALLDQGRAAVDLILTDVIMPGLTGAQLRDRVAVSHPGIRVVFMSGHAADAIAQRGVLDEHVDFIQKPFTLSALSQKVRRALDRS